MMKLSKRICGALYGGGELDLDELLNEVAQLEAENERLMDALHVLVVQCLPESTQELLAIVAPKHWAIVDALKDGE